MNPEEQIIKIGLTKLHRYIHKLRHAPLEAAGDGAETNEQIFRRLIVLTTNLANHIIHRQRLPVPSDPLEAFNVLCQAAILPMDIAERLRGVAALRVKLAHGYHEIPSAEVQAWVPHRLDDFEMFAAYVEKPWQE